MPLDKRTRDQLLEHCDRLHEDDCLNPRDFYKPQKNGRNQNRKALQLCRQVAETLDLVLSGDCRDEILQCLRVESVQPAPDSSRLLVTLLADMPRDDFDREAIQNLLNEQSGRLRHEVSTAITRRRVPNLVFYVIGPSELGEIEHH